MAVRGRRSRVNLLTSFLVGLDDGLGIGMLDGSVQPSFPAPNTMRHDADVLARQNGRRAVSDREPG